MEIGDCALPDGRTLLHLLVSSRFHEREHRQLGISQSTSAFGYAPAMSSVQPFGRAPAMSNVVQPGYEEQVKEWQDQAAPLLRLLLASPGATLRHDSNNKTAMDICQPQYKQFMSAMKNARTSAQPVHRGNSSSEQRQCVVCMDRRPSVVIIPCGHLCVCEPCSGRLQQQCPVCRGVATQMVRTYSP